jgi:beta-glucosidase
MLLLATAALAQSLPQLGQASLDEVVAAMTPAEKAQLLVGAGMAGFTGSAAVGQTRDLVPGAAGTTQPIKRLGIPAIVLADGPAGLRIAPRRDKDEKTYYCTAFPVATMLASTFDAGLVESVGEIIGKEVLEYGVDVLLGPALNIHRNALCGRNFEYYSEDPLLTGKIAAAMVTGVEKNGVGTSIKHFAANNQELMRTRNDARMTPRALREIYLKGFEIAVREAQPRTLMSSYNYINGTYTSESRALLTNILRDEWGFQGLVMTDWFGGKNASAQIHAGNDLLMPGRTDQALSILSAQIEKKLEGRDVDICVKRVLQLILESPRFKNYKYSNAPDLAKHAEIARQAAAEGMVLLKNTRNTLPLAGGVKKIAAFGNTSYNFISGGTGSGDVNEAYTISLVDGLVNAGYTLDSVLKNTYEAHFKAEQERNKPDKNNPLAAFMPRKQPAEYMPDAALIAAQAAANDIALITIGRNSGEFEDRKLEGDFYLSDGEKKLIAEVTTAFQKKGKKAVVILNIGGVIESASWKEIPDAILLAWQAGQEAGNAVADVISGKINPSGHLPMSWPIRYEDIASSKNFPADVTISREEMWADMMGQGKDHRDRRNIDYTLYEEDVYVGYRYFDTFRMPVSYPFGFGLSYTTFAYGKPVITEQEGGWTVRCRVTNTGKRPGKEAAQLYVSAPGRSMKKPEKELKAFAKTRLLQPGESQELTFELSPYGLASYDEARHAWVTEPGSYKLLIGSSSRDIKAATGFKIGSESISETHDVMRPLEKISTIR